MGELARSFRFNDGSFGSADPVVLSNSLSMPSVGRRISARVRNYLIIEKRG